MKVKLVLVGFALVVLAAGPANAVIISFDAGTPSDILNGGSLVSTPGTTPIGEVASYVSGGTGLVGQANVWPFGPSPAVAASEIGSHYWLQGTSSGILFQFSGVQSNVIAVAGIDHGPIPEEALEFVIWGSNAAGNLLEEGAIQTVWDLGVDPAGTTVGMSDDFSSLWTFSGSYTHFVARAGDHIANFSSPNEFEIDGIAAVIPEPGTLGLLGLGLLGMSLARWRRKRQH